MIYRFLDFTLDPRRGELRRGGELIPMQRKAFDVLARLVQEAHHTVSRADLLSAAWPDIHVSDASLRQAIKLARAALAPHQDVIQTQPGRGYQLVASVCVSDDPSSASGPLAGRLREPFVGRGRELDLLGGALQRAREGTGSVALISGEAGIGKTRLVEELLGLAWGFETEKVLAWCDEGNGTPPLWPWNQVVRSLAAGHSASRLRAVLGHCGASVQQVVPDLADGYLTGGSRLPAAPSRLDFFEGLTLLLQDAGKGGPLVLVVEDVHLASEPALRGLAFLARQVAQSAVLILATCRPHSSVPLRSTWTEITRHQGNLHLRLKGLDLAAIGQLISSISGLDLPDSHVRRLADRTRGNPLFLREIIGLLMADGSASLDHPDALAQTIPESVQQVIELQVLQLSTRTREVLQAAAMLGPEFEEGLLGAVAQVGRADLSRALSEGVEAELVRELAGRERSYAFEHALLQECLYRSLAMDRRRSLHLRAAEVLEQLCRAELDDRVVDLARHFVHADLTPGDPRAIDALRRAATWAMRRLDYESAATHLQKAVRLGKDSTSVSSYDLAEIHLALGEAQLRCGRRGPARESFLHAASIADSLDCAPLLARAALAITPGVSALDAGVLDPELMALIERALAKLDPDERRLRADLLARLAIERAWSAPEHERAELAHRAVSLARSSGEPRTLAHALTAQHIVLGNPDDLDQRLALSEEALSLASGTNDPEGIFLYRLIRAGTLLEAGDAEGCKRDQHILRRLALDNPQPRFQLIALGTELLWAHQECRLPDVDRLTEEVRELGAQSGERNAEHFYGIYRTWSLWEQGRLEEAREVVQDLIDRFPFAPWWPVRIWLNAQTGRTQEARRELYSYAEQRFESLRRDIIWQSVMGSLAEAAAELREREISQMLYDLLTPYSERLLVVVYGMASRGSVSRLLGMLAGATGRLADACKHFERALDIEARGCNFIWRAHTLYEYARLLNRADRKGYRSRLLQLLGDAREMTERCGLVALGEKLSMLSEEDR